MFNLQSMTTDLLIVLAHISCLWMPSRFVLNALLLFSPPKSPFLSYSCCVAETPHPQSFLKDGGCLHIESEPEHLFLFVHVGSFQKKKIPSDSQQLSVSLLLTIKLLAMMQFKMKIGLQTRGTWQGVTI